MTGATADDPENPADEIHFGSTRGGSDAPPRPMGRRGEPIDLQYLRQIRTGVVCMAVIMGVACLAVLGWSIYAWLQIASFSNQINNITPPANLSSCLSQSPSINFTC